MLNCSHSWESGATSYESFYSCRSPFSSIRACCPGRQVGQHGRWGPKGSAWQRHLASPASRGGPSTHQGVACVVVGASHSPVLRSGSWHAWAHQCLLPAGTHAFTCLVPLAWWHHRPAMNDSFPLTWTAMCPWRKQSRRAGVQRPTIAATSGTTSACMHESASSC